VPLAKAVSSNPWHWECVLLNGTNTIGTAHMNPSKEKLSFGGFDTSNFSADILPIVQKAESLPQVKNKDYEVRVLRMWPPVAFATVWLLSDSDGIFLPFKGDIYNAGLKSLEPYTEAQVVEKLKPKTQIITSPGAGS
jgi:hypothetical protein